jgi:cell division protein FtsI (penicillin-binding protein 3)
VEIPRRSNSMAAANRLTVVAAVLLLWGLRIFVALVSIQVSQHAKYKAIARAQQEHEFDIPAPRGTIFDRNGQPLAISMPADSVSVNPQQISDPKLATELLGNILHLDKQVLFSRLTWARDNHRGFMWVKRKMDSFETERLKALNLEWATVKTESQRQYPKGQTAAHVVGTVFHQEDGAAGIEKSLDVSLKGKAGAERMVMDVKRRGIDSHVDSVAQAGTPITLTIDERLQYVTERELKAGVEAKHARYGTAIVMDPNTGEILALANYPTYDPNKPPQPGETAMSRFDLGVSVPFEPGSIFKVVTLSAALETTNLTPESMIPTGGGTLVLPGRVIHESHHGFGTITMQQVLEQSSNIGAILIGQRVGREKMYEYARRFGFGQKTGLPLPAESTGMLRPVSKWGTTSLASISMGHEVSTTSAQLARLCSIIANGGMLVRPKIVLKRGDRIEPTEAAVRVLKPDTVMKMRMMMEGVVLRGTAKSTARLDGYTSAGKTGTAQIFENGHYTHLYNASFMGFTPVINPQLVIVVTINGTNGDGGMGSAAAAPVFRNIATEALRMLDVPKDIPDSIADVKKPKKEDKAVEDVSIAGLGGGSIMAEDQTVKDLLAEEAKLAQLIAADSAESIPSAPGSLPQPAFAAPAPKPPVPRGSTVPDFRGKSMRSVVEEASAEGIEVMIEGSGVARAQVPQPGKPLRRGERIRIVFTR